MCVCVCVCVCVYRWNNTLNKPPYVPNNWLNIHIRTHTYTHTCLHRYTYTYTQLCTHIDGRTHGKNRQIRKRTG